MSRVLSCPECSSTNLEELSSGVILCLDCDMDFDEEEAEFVESEDDDGEDGLKEEDFY